MVRNYDENDGFSFGGQVLPVKNTSGWDRISFQVYTSVPVTTFRMELFQGADSQGNFTLSSLTIPANKWTTVSFSLTDMAMINKTFDKVQMQIAGGSDVTSIVIYSDNFKFEKGPVTSAPLGLAGNSGLKVYPNPASGILHVIVPDQSYQIAEIIGMTGQTVAMKNINSEVLQMDISHLKAGMYLMLVKGEKGILSSRFVVK